MADHNQRLIQVVKRLDQLTSSIKTQHINQNNSQQTHQTISQVQQMNWSFPQTTEIDQFLSTFQEKGLSLSQYEKIPIITQVSLKIFGDMKKILEFTYQAKKPTDGVVKQIQQILSGKMQVLVNIQNEKSKYSLHAKAVHELLNCVYWIFNSQAPFQFVEMTIESSEYTALKFKSEKIQEINQWYNSLISATKELIKYIKQNFPTGPSFAFKGTDDYQDLINALSRDTDLQPKQTQPQIQEPNIAQQQFLKPQIPQSSTQSAFKELFSLLDEAQNYANQSSIEQLQNIMKIVVEVFKKMDIIVREAKNFQGTPQQPDLQEIQKWLTKQLDPLFVIKKNLEFKDIVMAFTEGTNVAFWVFMQGNPKEMIKGAIESSEYHALKLKAKKIQPQTECYNNFHKGLQFVLSHTLMNYPNGLKWGTPSGTLNKQTFIDILKGSEQQQAQIQPIQQVQQVQPPPLNLGAGGPPSLGLLLQLNPDVANEHTQPKNNNPAPQQQNDAKQALFSSLNVGMDDIKKHLRHVDKKQLQQEKEERAQKLQEKVQNKQQESVQTKEIQKKEKPPKKFFKDNWYFENFKDSELQFEEGEDVAPKMSIFVDNCKNSFVKVTKKCNQIFVNNCQKVTIVFESLVSGVVSMNSKNLTIICLDFCPSISLDKCQQTQIRLNKNLETDIITSQCAETNVTWMETDEPAKDTAIPEQFITRWDKNHKKFVTKLFEQEW